MTDKTKSEELKTKKKNAKKKEKGKSKAKLSAKLEKIINQIAELSVLELSDLVKALEDKFGIQAIAAAPVAAGTTQTGNEKPAEEKSIFTVILTETGSNKIGVIKALREVKPDLGLKEAKDITEKTPADVLIEVKKEQAEEAKKKLEKAGAKVELK